MDEAVDIYWVDAAGDGFIAEAEEGAESEGALSGGEGEIMPGAFMAHISPSLRV